MDLDGSGSSQTKIRLAASLIWFDEREEKAYLNNFKFKRVKEMYRLFFKSKNSVALLQWYNPV